MSIQITIVGLGQIGGSLGLALKKHAQRVTRVGHDHNLETMRQAEKAGAVDRTAYNLPASVREADMVILALPMHGVKETLEVIAQDLKDGAVVMETSPVKQVVNAWMGEFLPSGRHYIGLTPVLNPAYLDTGETGLAGAHADLFHDGLMGITTPTGVDSAAIKLAVDLTKLVGAEPFFADIVEMDSLMSATQLVPQLLSAALINATVNQPGWREARKVAGRAYAEVTGAHMHMSKPPALSSAALLNREHVLRVLDALVGSLERLRTQIEGQDEAGLIRELEQARQGRERWWAQRIAANWLAEEVTPAVEPPTAGEHLGRLIGLGRRTKPKKEG